MILMGDQEALSLGTVQSLPSQENAVAALHLMMEAPRREVALLQEMVDCQIGMMTMVALGRRAEALVLRGTALMIGGIEAPMKPTDAAKVQALVQGRIEVQLMMMMTTAVLQEAASHRKSTVQMISPCLNRGRVCLNS